MIEWDRTSTSGFPYQTFRDLVVVFIPPCGCWICVGAGDNRDGTAKRRNGNGNRQHGAAI